MRNFNTGEEKSIYNLPVENLGDHSVSPNGQWVSSLERQPGTTKVLKIISTDSGVIKQVINFNGKNNPSSIRHAWSADSKYVFYSRRERSGADTKSEVWRVPIDGGQPQKTGLEMPGVIDYMSARPDGKKLAFENMAPMSESPAEVWAMDNFLTQGR